MEEAMAGTSPLLNRSMSRQLADGSLAGTLLVTRASAAPEHDRLYRREERQCATVPQQRSQHRADPQHSPTPGMVLRNGSHPDCCRGAGKPPLLCCWRLLGRNPEHIDGNAGRGVAECFSQNSLVSTRDTDLHRACRSAEWMREAQESNPGVPPNYREFRERSYITSALLPKLTTQRHTLVNTLEFCSPLAWTMSDPAVASGRTMGGCRVKDLPPAGDKTETAFKKKVVNFSAVEYNLLSEQATPMDPRDKTAFMSMAHRDRALPAGCAGPVERPRARGSVTNFGAAGGGGAFSESRRRDLSHPEPRLSRSSSSGVLTHMAQAFPR